jgi:hypothetical protein
MPRRAMLDGFRPKFGGRRRDEVSRKIRKLA